MLKNLLILWADKPFMMICSYLTMIRPYLYFIIAMAENNSQQIPTNIPFNRIGVKQRELIEQLGGFSMQHSFLNLLKKQYGDTNLKQKFISLNKSYINHDDMALLNQQHQKYKKQLREGSTMIIFTSTLASLIIAIAFLPARRSPLKYTVAGFGAGVCLSYGFWRLQLNRYDKRVNNVFRNIVRQQFMEKKGLL